MPETTSNDVPRPIRELFEKATLAYQRNNFDYAIQILNGVLHQEPGFFEARQLLRATQQQKPQEKTGLFRKLVGGAGNAPLLVKGQLALRNNPKDALSAAESILNSDPGNTSAHKLLAEGAMALGLTKTAVMALETVIASDPNDAKVARNLAGLYFQQDQLDKAEELYRNLMVKRPDDTELPQTLKNLAARRMLVEKGYGAVESGNSSYRDLIKDKEEALHLEQANRSTKDDTIADRLIAEYEVQLKNEPNNRRTLRAIAELHSQKKEFDRAIGYLRGVIAAEGNSDPTVEKAIADIEAKRVDHALSRLDPAATDFVERKSELEAQRDAQALAECKGRAERFPSDLQIRFELGSLHFKAGRFSDAIQELQRAQNSPQRRTAAINMLGQCFASRKMWDLAARTFYNALKEKPTWDEEKKELLYHLGSALEKLNKPDEAIEHFKNIYEQDIGYRDVAAKVDAYYAAQ